MSQLNQPAGSTPIELASAVAVPSRPGRKRLGMERKEELTFYLMISPWIIGFMLFFVFPLVSSLYYSLTSWDLLQTPKWVGLDNYVRMFTKDPLFWTSLKVTLVYTLGTVLLGTAGSLLLALLLNQPIRGAKAFRAIYYMPAVISGVAVAQLWRMVFNPDFGIINLALRSMGIQGPGWLADPRWALPSLILISLWGIGGGMIIFLAALQGIPQHLYEAAEIDGAGAWNRFTNITLPMLSPAILFSLITNTIGSFQAFTQVFVLTQGGPANATKVYALHLYLNAFQFFKMGYASAMAWFLFIVMILITIVQMKFSSQWVHYESGDSA